MKKKENFFENEDMKFHFKNTINWKTIIPLYEKDSNVEESIETYEAILNELGTIAGTELAPTAKETDETGAKLENGEVIYTPGTQKVLQLLKETEALALNVKKEYNGYGMPGIMHMINMEMISKADPSFMTVYAFYSGVAKTLEQFGSEELKKEYIPKLVKGECNGSMALTEPNAGSDLGGIKTRAEKKENHYEITGTKIFITNGNGELSLVLARSDPDSKGTEGISMFLVPRHKEKEVKNFELSKLEHKLGIKGSPTIEMVFDKSTGYLVGKEGQGVKQMFYLMNEARLGVSAQALGIAQAAFEEAKAYTKERVQFDKPICKHELVADKLLDMETDLKAMRSLLYKAAEYDDIKSGLEDKLRSFEGSQEEKEKLEKKLTKYKFLARDLIPLVKYFNSEKSISICRDALQLYGGYGFTTEYNAERHLRDSIITAIYEGTSQIQALMAMGDTLKKSKVIPYLEPLKSVGKLFKTFFKTDLDFKRAEAEVYFNDAVDHLRRPFLMAKLKKNKKLGEALSYSMLSAERLTRIKSYKVITDILVEEAKNFPERKPLAERFIRNYLPEMRKECERICNGDKTTLEYIKSIE